MRSFSNIMPNFADKLHLLVDSIRSEKQKKNGFFFCFSLAYSYLCTRYSRGARKLWAEMIPYNLMRIIPT